MADNQADVTVPDVPSPAPNTVHATAGTDTVSTSADRPSPPPPKPADPPFCVDCSHHFTMDQPVTGETWHFCGVTDLVDLVTGRSDRAILCDVQRAGAEPNHCGPAGSQFNAASQGASS